MNYAAATDEALMEAYAATLDKVAFKILFDRYSDRLMAFFVRGTRHPEGSRDLLQTTFLHVHRARKDYDPGRPFKPWIYTIAANVRREYWRRRKRKPEASLDPEQQARIPGAGPDTTTRTDRLVRRALEALPDNQKDVMLMRWYGGLTFPEIAESLGIKTTAAKVRAHRATKALRKILGGENDVA